MTNNISSVNPPAPIDSFSASNSPKSVNSGFSNQSALPNNNSPISTPSTTNSQASSPAGSNKNTLFLGDLSTFCTEESIRKLFSPYGEILEIKIMKSEETNRNLSYGFLKFSNPISARKALNALNGKLFEGRNLRIGWATFRNKKEAKLLALQNKTISSSVHVSYISYQLDNLITEETLRVLFSSFGVVLDTSIKKSYIDKSINRQCGYGFVHYASNAEGIRSALSAVASLNDSTVYDACYKCSISHNLEKHLESLRNTNALNYQLYPNNLNSMNLGSNVNPNLYSPSNSSLSPQANFNPSIPQEIRPIDQSFFHNENYPLFNQRQHQYYSNSPQNYAGNSDHFFQQKNTSSYNLMGDTYSNSHQYYNNFKVDENQNHLSFQSNFNHNQYGDNKFRPDMYAGNTMESSVFFNSNQNGLNDQFNRTYSNLSTNEGEFSNINRTNLSLSNQNLNSSSNQNQILMNNFQNNQQSKYSTMNAFPNNNFINDNSSSTYNNFQPNSASFFSSSNSQPQSNIPANNNPLGFNNNFKFN